MEVVTVFVFVRTMGTVTVNCSVTVTVEGERERMSETISGFVPTSFCVGVLANGYVLIGALTTD